MKKIILFILLIIVHAFTFSMEDTFLMTELSSLDNSLFPEIEGYGNPIENTMEIIQQKHPNSEKFLYTTDCPHCKKKLWSPLEKNLLNILNDHPCNIRKSTKKKTSVQKRNYLFTLKCPFSKCKQLLQSNRKPSDTLQSFRRHLKQKHNFEKNEIEKYKYPKINVIGR
jgi:hypothetical protein